MTKWLSSVCASAVLLSLSVLPPAAAFAQAPAGSASEFYLKYRQAFDAANKVEELLPYMSAATRKQVESTPAGEREKMFELIKIMGALTNMKIVKETPTATGATLTVEAVDSDKAKTTGTIEIVREGGTWKLGKESWSTKSQ
jgi:hypothetical protein